MQKKYVSPQQKSRSFHFRILVGFLGFFVVLSGLVLAILYLGQSQDTRRHASVGQSQVALSVNSSTVDNEHLKVNILVNAGSFQVAGLDIRGSLTGMNASDVAIQNGSTLALSSVLDKLTQASGSVTFQIVRFASTDPAATLSTNGQSVVFVSFVIAKPQNNQVTISFDSVNSSFSLLGQSVTNVDYPSSTTFTLTPSQSTPQKGSCNTSCSGNSDCQSGLVCYSGACRKAYNSTDASCGNAGGFFIRTFNDVSGDGKQQSSELGLSWKYQWMSNNDGTWRDYETFKDKNGEGGVVTLPTGTTVIIRQVSVSGWNATTPTQPSTTIVTGENKSMVFGVRQPVVKQVTPRPTAYPTATPVSTPLPTTYVTPRPTPLSTPTISVMENLLPTPVSTPIPTLIPQVAARTNPLTNPIVLIVIGVLGLGAAYFLYRGLR